MKMFVVAANIFTVLMYLIYAFAFPINSDEPGGKLFDLYTTLMVFSIISGILVIFQIASGARRIEGLNAGYGKILRIQGTAFLFANLVQALVFYALSSGKFVIKDLGFVFSVLFQFAFFGATETLPLLTYVMAQRKFLTVMNPPPVVVQPEQQE